MSDVQTFKVSVKDGKASEKILSIQVDGESISKEYDAFYRSVEPRAKIPGFRPGKAPRKVLVMHYAQEARQEVLKHLISDSYRWALESKEIKPLLSPQIDEVQFDDKSLSYKAWVEVRPKIKLSRVEGLSAKKESAAVKPSEVDDQLKRIQESQARFKGVEDRAAQMGDCLIVDYVCTVDGREIENRKEDWLEIREEEFLKGFSKQLVGVRPGEMREVRVAFPEQSGREELRGKEGVFRVQVKEIKAKDLPPLNDDLAKDAGEYQTLADLKAKIENDLRVSKESEVEAAFEKALLEELVKHNKLELPNRLVEQRLEYLLGEARQNFLKHQGREEDFEKRRAEIAKELQPEAVRQVHVAFLLDEIAGIQKIEASEEDLQNKLKEMAGRFGRSVEEVEQYYSDREDARENLKELIRTEKAIVFIKQNAKQK